MLVLLQQQKHILHKNLSFNSDALSNLKNIFKKIVSKKKKANQIENYLTLQRF